MPGSYGDDPLNDEFDPIVAIRTWPRIYLDTSDLLDIADGTVDAAVVDELLTVIAAQRIVVVFTVEHLVDVVEKGLPEGAEQLGEVAERFPWRVMVTTDPTQIEPWREPGADIGIEFAPNIRNVFAHPAAHPLVRRFLMHPLIIHSTPKG